MPAQEPASTQLALLVEGDAEIERALREMLEPNGWKVALAADNAAALELVKQQHFSFIVTASHSSNAEDLQLLREMRRVYPHTRMIIVTDECTPQDVLESMRERAFSYFAKPFSLDAFAQIVMIAMNCPCWDDGIEVASGTPDQINLFVRCDAPTADRLLQFMREISGLPEKEGKEAAVAIREMLYNAIEHGGQFNPQQYVEVTYVRTRKMVTCRIKDPGEGFSLEELRHAAIANPPEDPLRHAMVREQQGMRPGGYGVLLAQQLVDELLYNDKGNEVYLVKYLEGAHPATGSAQ
jgi:anti-sigma regulatory factor (Ser/Thr protein kinase)